VDRQTVLWTLVLFFGASLVFDAIKRATDDESTGVTLAIEAAVLVAAVAVIVVVVRRRGRD
jgi:membrane protein DedA with SNARE-associated domain